MPCECANFAQPTVHEQNAQERGKKGWNDVCEALASTEMFAGKRISAQTCKRAFKQIMAATKARQAAAKEASGVAEETEAFHELADRMLAQQESLDALQVVPVCMHIRMPVHAAP